MKPTLLFLLLAFNLFAQVEGEGSNEVIPPPRPFDEENVVIEEIIEFPDVEATFPCHTFYTFDSLGYEIGSDELCGKKGMMRFISEETIIPDICTEMNAMGRVFVKFCVEKDGSLTNITIERNGTDCPDYNKACKNVLRKMPKWIPGEAQGRYQRTWHRIPFKFAFN